MQHPIISMVRAVCKRYGIRFIVARKPCTNLGLFDSADRTLTIWPRYMRGRGKRRGKPRVQKTSQADILITALHEMVHLCQWKRRDKNWYLLDVNGKRIDHIIYDALCGDRWDDTPALYQSALAAARLEFEAEITALRIMDLFGVKYPRGVSIRAAKAYAYSYLVFARTGIMGDMRMWERWQKYLSNTLSFDITYADLDKLCDIARAHPRETYVVWADNVCTKCIW